MPKLCMQASEVLDLTVTPPTLSGVAMKFKAKSAHVTVLEDAEVEFKLLHDQAASPGDYSLAAASQGLQIAGCSHVTCVSGQLHVLLIA